MNDELFERMNSIDPHPDSAPVTPHDGPVARTLMESIMNTPASTPTPADSPTDSPTVAPRSRRTGLIAGGVAAAAAAAVAIVIGVGGLGTSTTDEAVPDTTSAPDTTPAPDTTAPVTTEPGTSLTIVMTPSDPMASCLQLSDHVPDPSSPAFGGRVVSVGDGTVTVAVDRWFQNGDADQVVITVSDTGMVETGIEGTALVEGAELLVTVIDGNVATCGLSGGASPELLAFYETWYG
jgi:hypothetical protein